MQRQDKRRSFTQANSTINLTAIRIQLGASICFALKRMSGRFEPVATSACAQYDCEAAFDASRLAQAMDDLLPERFFELANTTGGHRRTTLRNYGNETAQVLGFPTSIALVFHSHWLVAALFQTSGILIADPPSAPAVFLSNVVREGHIDPDVLAAPLPPIFQTDRIRQLKTQHRQLKLDRGRRWIFDTQSSTLWLEGGGQVLIGRGETAQSSLEDLGNRIATIIHGEEHVYGEHHPGPLVAEVLDMYSGELTTEEVLRLRGAERLLPDIREMTASHFQIPDSNVVATPIDAVVENQEPYYRIDAQVDGAWSAEERVDARIEWNDRLRGLILDRQEPTLNESLFLLSIVDDLD